MIELEKYENDGRYIEIVDIDGDKDIDIIEWNWYGDDVFLYENLGNEVFEMSKLLLTLKDLRHLLFGDINLDGTQDIVAWGDEKMVYFKNLGDRVFSAAIDALQFESSSDRPRNLIMSDLDLDGDPELIYCTSYRDKIVFHENLLNSDIITGYETTENLESFGIYPNPTSNTISLPFLFRSVPHLANF